jgi:hypothetical protein
MTDHEKSLVGVDDSDKVAHVVALAVLVLGDDFHVLVTREHLHKTQVFENVFSFPVLNHSRKVRVAWCSGTWGR